MAAVYRSRWRTTRRRLLVGAAVVALVLVGFLVGRLQSDAPTAASGAPSGSTSVSPAEEPRAEQPSAAAPAGIDAYAPLRAENAPGKSGVQVEDTGDVGGGQNVGWINNGDWLRFDEIDFGDTPPVRLDARVASDVADDGGGRLEIRLDSPSAEPVATLVTSNTGGWQSWRTETTDMTPVTGVHTVFVTFGSDRPDDFLNVNYVKFAR